jgi:hypothetical protein
MTAEKVKAGKASRKNDPFWEMRTGGLIPRRKATPGNFQMHVLRAETAPEKGWNGAPDKQSVLRRLRLPDVGLEAGRRLFRPGTKKL